MKLSANVMNRRPTGFTLVELMITIAIIAIAAAVVVPGYQNSVKKSQRSDAQSALSDLANHMMQHRLSNGAFPNQFGSKGIVFPQYVPFDKPTSEANYKLSISNATGTTFTLQATPIKGSMMDGDGKLQLDHLGQTFWDKNNNGTFQASEKSWR